MSKYTIKSKKWYWWFWLPERRKVKIMQALLDHMMTPEMEKKIQKDVNDYLIYGIEPVYKEQK